MTFQQSFLDKVYTYRQCVLFIALSSFQQLHLEVFFLVFVIRSLDSDSSSSKPLILKMQCISGVLLPFISQREQKQADTPVHIPTLAVSPAKINCCARSHIYHCSTFGQVRTSCSTLNMKALGFDTASTPCACHRRITLALKPVTALSRSRSC